MKVTSEDFTKLQGPNGERFTSEGEYREPKVGEWYVRMNDGVPFQTEKWEQFDGTRRIVLTSAKTAREWLAEWDAPGWREEALAHADEVQCGSLRHAIMDCIPKWESLPSGWDGWRDVLGAINNGTKIPPHPSTVKPAPKIVRLPVSRLGCGLVGGSLPIQDWIGRHDFRGFAFVLPNGKEVEGLSATIIWRPENDSHCGLWSYARSEYYNIPLHPSFVEVEQ